MPYARCLAMLVVLPSLRLIQASRGPLSFDRKRCALDRETTSVRRCSATGVHLPAPPWTARPPPPGMVEP
eukprot:4187792-Pyramimonas_sp.AAC.1